MLAVKLCFTLQIDLLNDFIRFFCIEAPWPYLSIYNIGYYE